jgi:rhodanese-related sulfurtransferase
VDSVNGEFFTVRLTNHIQIIALAAIVACSGPGEQTKSPPAPSVESGQPAISGRIEDGLRVLTFDPDVPEARLTIYRGDYVRPEVAGGGPFTLEVPELDLVFQSPVPAGERPYFKVAEPGVYAVRIGEWTGELEVIEYSDSHYREVDSQLAARLIADRQPFVLDVRTPSEFASGHIEGAVLIPVQALAQRLGELDEVKERPVFVYCRSGNRSTVAARMLVDAGFDEVINLRRGIVEWEREGLPVVK